VLGLTAFSVGLAAVAVATSALSYAGIHAVAQQGGIQARYARGYPLLIDALLIIVLAAVLALRGAGLPSRILSWLALLVLLGAAAGAEALHATGRALPRDAAAVTVAVLPWLLVLITFVLLLAMLRHARLRRLARVARTSQAAAYPGVDARGRPQQTPPSATPPAARTPHLRNSAPIVPDISSRLVSGAAAGAAAAERESRGPAGGRAPPAAPALPGESSAAPAPGVREPVEWAEQPDADRPDG
jgi:hypothetical protein